MAAIESLKYLSFTLEKSFRRLISSSLNIQCLCINICISSSLHTLFILPESNFGNIYTNETGNFTLPRESTIALFIINLFEIILTVCLCIELIYAFIIIGKDEVSSKFSISLNSITPSVQIRECI